jgi:hypothetical protein
MRKRTLFYASLCSILLSASADGGPKLVEGTIKYANAERTRYFKLMAGSIVIGEIGTSHGGEKQDQVSIDREVGAKAYDCSGMSYRCIKAIRTVFAVPRGALHSAATYEVLGTRFEVLKCFRGNNNICHVALISADCTRIKNAENCAIVRDARNKSDRPGPISYFIYNDRFGITSFGIVDEKAHSAEQLNILARMFVLQGDIGFLH